MKKLGFLCAIFVAVILITGCGSTKTLTCTLSETSEGMKMDQEITMNFKDDKVEYVKVNMITSAEDEELKTSWDLLTSILDSSFDVENSEGITISTNNDKENYKYEISYEVDLEKASTEKLAELGMEDIVDADESYEETKKAAEEDGYTCK